MIGQDMDTHRQTPQTASLIVLKSSQLINKPQQTERWGNIRQEFEILSAKQNKQTLIWLLCCAATSLLSCFWSCSAIYDPSVSLQNVCPDFQPSECRNTRSRAKFRLFLRRETKGVTGGGAGKWQPSQIRYVGCKDVGPGPLSLCVSPSLSLWGSFQFSPPLSVYLSPFIFLSHSLTHSLIQLVCFRAALSPS